MKRPRLWETAENIGANQQEIAYHLGMSVSRFCELLPKLQKAGFPKPDELTGTYCVPEVDVWWKARHNVLEPANIDEPDVLGEKLSSWRPRKSA